MSSFSNESNTVLFFLLLIISTCCNFKPVVGTCQKYVSKDGSDLLDCSEKFPCKTLARALDKCTPCGIAPDDHIGEFFLEPGEYNECDIVLPRCLTSVLITAKDYSGGKSVDNTALVCWRTKTELRANETMFVQELLLDQHILRFEHILLGVGLFYDKKSRSTEQSGIVGVSALSSGKKFSLEYEDCVVLGGYVLGGYNSDFVHTTSVSVSLSNVNITKDDSKTWSDQGISTLCYSDFEISLDSVDVELGPSSSFQVQLIALQLNPYGSGSVSVSVDKSHFRSSLIFLIDSVAEFLETISNSVFSCETCYSSALKNGISAQLIGLLVSSCKFQDISVVSDDNAGGMEIVFSDTLTQDGNAVFAVEKTNFTNVTSIHSGALSMMATFAKFGALITDCNFEENHAGDSGGAISISGTSTVDIFRCKFTSNTATLSGGALDIGGSQVQVRNCIFEENFAPYDAIAKIMPHSRNVSLYSNTFACACADLVENDVSIDSIQLNIATMNEPVTPSDGSFMSCPNGYTFSMLLDPVSSVYSCACNGCPKGTYLLTGGTSNTTLGCYPCPSNADCFVSTVIPHDGYWVANGDECMTYSCPTGYCSSSSSSKTSSGCSSQRGGFLCGKCADEPFCHSMKSECVECGQCGNPTVFLLGNFFAAWITSVGIVLFPGQNGLQKVFAYFLQIVSVVSFPRDTLFSSYNSESGSNFLSDLFRLGSTISSMSLIKSLQKTSCPFKNMSMASITFLELLAPFLYLCMIVFLVIVGYCFAIRVDFSLAVVRLFGRILWLPKKKQQRKKRVFPAFWNLNDDDDEEEEHHRQVEEMVEGGTSPLLSADFGSLEQNQKVEVDEDSINDNDNNNDDIVISLSESVAHKNGEEDMYGDDSDTKVQFQSQLKKLVCSLIVPWNRRRRAALALSSWLLLSYQTLTSVTLSFLHCPSFNSVAGEFGRRWYLDGEVHCFRWYQVIFVIIAVTFVFPFPFFILLYRWIAKSVFFGAGKCFDVASDAKKKQRKQVFAYNSATQAILYNLEEPYRPCVRWWESVMMAKRLILMSCVTFLSDPYQSAVLVSVFCVLFLAIHLIFRPFHERCVNYLGALSLTVLSVLSVLKVKISVEQSIGISVESSAVETLMISETLLVFIVVALFVVAFVLLYSYELIAFFVGWAGKLLKFAKGIGSIVRIVLNEERR